MPAPCSLPHLRDPVFSSVSLGPIGRRCCALLLLLAGSLLFPGGAQAAIRAVWPDGFGFYPTIQAAWDAAESGDVIELQDGDFAGPGNTDLVLNGKSVLVCSASGDPATCRIDFAVGSIGFSGGASPSFSRIQFLRTNGFDAKQSTLHFTNCVFEQCEQVTLAIGGTNYQFDQCSFRHGTGRLFGDVEGTIGFLRCNFLDNAGGVASSVAMSFEDCLFRGNSAPLGSAVIESYFLFYPQQTTLHGCRFLDNLAPSVAAFDGIVDIDHCLFARGPAPAVAWTLAFDTSIGLSITNSTFAEVTGGPAIRLRKEWDLLSLTVSIDHTIIASTEGGPALECIGLVPMDIPALACCCLYGNSGGNYAGCLDGQGGANGNLELDPRFCSPTDRHYELQDTSPCASDPSCGRIGALGVGCASAAVSPPLTSELEGLRIEPNPFRQAIVIRLSGDVDATLLRAQILDSTGREVARLEGAGIGIEPTLRWNGRNADREPVPAGVYFVRAVTTTGLRTASVLRLH